MKAFLYVVLAVAVLVAVNFVSDWSRSRQLAHQVASCSVNERETDPKFYWVQPDQTSIEARIPQGKLLLIRSAPEKVVAVRLTSVKNAPSDGPDSGCATYEVFDLSNNARPSLCSGTVSSFEVVGSHLTAHNPGDDLIPCIPAIYRFPTMVRIDLPYQMALTRWSVPEQVDLSNPQLLWFDESSGDGSRVVTVISESELPN